MTYPTPDVEFTYEFLNRKRDVSVELSMVQVAMPLFISLIATAPYLAQAHKHEWFEDVHTPEETTLTAAALVGGTTLTVASKAPFRLGSNVRIGGSDEIVRVTAIASNANELTVVRAIGGTTAKAIPNGTKIGVISNPRPEASNPELVSAKGAPTSQHNFTEIFDGETVVPKSKGPIYGVGSNSEDPVGAMINYRMQNEFRKMTRRRNLALLMGPRIERSDSVAGSMGGLMHFMRTSQNKIAAAGAQITEGLLGDAFERAMNSGSDGVDTILCGPRQARNITRLYKAQLQILRTEQTLGNTIYRVQSEIPLAGFVGEIVVDSNWYPDKIWIGARRDIKLVTQRPYTDENSAPNGADFLARRIIGEETAEFNAVDKKAALIEGLSEQLIA